MNLHNFVLYNFRKLNNFGKNNSKIGFCKIVCLTVHSYRLNSCIRPRNVPPVENNRLKGWSVTSDPQVFRL